MEFELSRSIQIRLVDSDTDWLRGVTFRIEGWTKNENEDEEATRADVDGRTENNNRDGKQN